MSSQIGKYGKVRFFRGLQRGNLFGDPHIFFHFQVSHTQNYNISQNEKEQDIGPTPSNVLKYLFIAKLEPVEVSNVRKIYRGHRTGFPIRDPGKKRTFPNFPICEDIKYHYYLIYTLFRRKNGGEFNEVLFRFFHFIFNVFEGTGGQHHTPRHVSLGAFFYLSMLKKTVSGT